MSDGLNRVMLMGHLGADAEIRFTQAGQAVLNWRLATTESYVDKDKVRRERTDWHSCVLWGARAEGLSKILAKGTLIYCEGSLRTSSYDNREGQKVWKTEVIVREVILTGGRGRGGAQGGEEHDAREPPRGEGGYARSGGGRPASGGQGGGTPRQAPPAPAAAPPPQDDCAGDYGGGGDDDIPF